VEILVRAHVVDAHASINALNFSDEDLDPRQVALHVLLACIA